MTRVFSPAGLAHFSEEIARAAGFESEDAKILSQSLIDAELRGIGSHGLVHLPMHIEELERGLLNPKPNIQTVKDAGATMVLEGDFGLGQKLAIHATDLAVERAARFGTAIVGVRNSGSFGVAGYYPLRAAAKGMIGFSLQNTAPHLAPPGGVDALIGNNPFAFAVPTGDVPIVLDIACSSVARANLIMAAKNKEKIPLDWAIDPQGKPTDDPEQALIGALLPFAGHKGYGIAFVLGLLSGPLLGLDDRTFTRTMYFPRPKGYGVIVAAIDISHFVDRSVFQTYVQDWIGRLRSARVAPNADPIRFPGERSHQLKKMRERDGIALTSPVVNDLVALARKFKCEFPDPLSEKSRIGQKA
jgi:LDH2 family malate/lactate/ureidoglycolate dehydrogenase